MNRLLISEKFHELCPNVYYQPPPSVKLKYPCIIYERRSGDTTYADNKPYRFDYSYTVTYIDPDPDSDVPLKIAELPMCKMDRCFTSDNLNHSIFVIYYHISPTDLTLKNELDIDVPHSDNSTTLVLKSGNTVMLDAYVDATTFFLNGVTRIISLTSELIPERNKNFNVEISNASDGKSAYAIITVTSSGFVYLTIKDQTVPHYDTVTFRVFYQLD